MKDVVEVLLFATSEPLTQAKLNACLQDTEVNLDEVVDQLNADYEKGGSGLFIGKIAGGYQILSKPEYHLYIQRLYNKTKKLQLSRAATEALAVIAYKQPISRSEIEIIRGVNCDSVIRSLLERELITIRGRDDGPGRAILYGTTHSFLEGFGLSALSDLPKLKELSELMPDNDNTLQDASEAE